MAASFTGVPAEMTSPDDGGRGRFSNRATLSRKSLDVSAHSDATVTANTAVVVPVIIIIMSVLEERDAEPPVVTVESATVRKPCDRGDVQPPCRYAKDSTVGRTYRDDVST